MSNWPTTRVTLLDRLRNPCDQEAWAEFVSLYGPLMFNFARRRLPQDEDAADVLQEVLRAVLQGRYQRPKGRFQKWLITILLNKIRDYHTAQGRRHERVADICVCGDLAEEPSQTDEEEWEEEQKRHLLHIASDRVQARSKPIHWDVFVKTALENQPGQEVAASLKLSLTNVYAIKSRIIKEIKDEICRLSED